VEPTDLEPEVPINQSCSPASVRPVTQPAVG
jgi:hypothetical protein